MSSNRTLDIKKYTFYFLYILINTLIRVSQEKKALILISFCNIYCTRVLYTPVACSLPGTTRVVFHQSFVFYLKNRNIFSNHTVPVHNKLHVQNSGSGKTVV